MRENVVYWRQLIDSLITHMNDFLFGVGQLKSIPRKIRELAN